MIEFDPDLYRGTARDYDRFRVPYSLAMIDARLGATGPSGRGRLLDLAKTIDFAYEVARR